MASALNEYFGEVVANDIHDYGYGSIKNFLEPTDVFRSPVDWIITNPPFRLAEDFLFSALPMARIGVALLVRTVFIESVGRYTRIFAENPPAFVAQFCERVAMVKGRVDPKASTATGYCWIVWTKADVDQTELRWIKPCRKLLERATDYEPEFLTPAQNEGPEERDLFGALG